MPLRLPPLASLRFFEAAGRHLSFKCAAEELNVTPSAVSHGILALERGLGVQLFLREPRRLTLTPAGADYLRSIAEALSLIATATERLPAERARRGIALSCAPTIAARWLLPRLHKFNRAWPDVAVIVDTSRRQVGFPADGFDFAIRMSRTALADPAWIRLFGERLVPVCSPAYLETLRDGNKQVDLSRATLIRNKTASEDWAAWLQRTGTDLAPRRQVEVDTITLSFEAAANGLGVALGRRPLVDADLDSGALVEAGETIAAETAYWLVSSEGAGRHAELKAFRRWLVAEVDPAWLAG
jgi:DNA-binding transcriptional LysR family regulator